MRRVLIALRVEVPSLEANLLTRFFRKMGEVKLIDGWDVDSHTQVYDLAVCVGPVSSSPLAKKRVLFVFGPSFGHRDLDWDIVVATSPKMLDTAVSMFGQNARVFLASPPLLNMESGRRRLMEPKKTWMQGSNLWSFVSDGDVDHDPLTRMTMWSLPEDGRPLFSPMEFNSLALNGGRGFYLSVPDGYDIQVRRHLALGSPVVCEREYSVIGELADVCFDSLHGVPDRIEPIPDPVREEDYVAQLDEIMRRV